MRKSAVLFLITLLLAAVAGGRAPSAQLLNLNLLSPLAKLDPLTTSEVGLLGSSRVVVRAAEEASALSLVPLIQSVGGVVVRTVPLVDSLVAIVPNASLTLLAVSPLVARVSLDRRVVGSMERTGATIGAAAIREQLGYDGSGVGVAVIDSGVTSWHDDLAGQGGGQRVARFVDFVNGWLLPYDDYGHGSHVAGIVAGNGFDSSGARSGIAPAAHLVVLKVLDGSGAGYISDVLAALDYVVEHRASLGIRIVNLSVAAGVYESYQTDPLTLAAKRAVESGVIVVAAAGNAGRNPDGRNAYGGVTAPGNAPWVLTIGASSHMGTVATADDAMAVFSSRGPSRVDYAAKPDLVAPGVGIESLSDPDSAFYSTKSQYLLHGTVERGYLPYLSLSGTSMAAPVVTGTLALMLQANPSLTPNLAKAILQFTARTRDGYDALTQGTGFLNASAAVNLARHFASPATVEHPSTAGWSRRLIWGNKLLQGPRLSASANAWGLDVTWGRPRTPAGQTVTWGFWNGFVRNAVWGSLCSGSDCQGTAWTVSALSDDDQSVVWGTDNPDESVVWGTDDDMSVVWGTNCGDSACVPVVWPTP